MKLTEFRSIFDLLEALPTETSCIRYLEQLRWPSGPVSPYDPASVVYNRGDGLYRCKTTGKNFNVRIGTIFEGSKIPLRKWFIAIYLIASSKKGISSTLLAEYINVTQKTAWFMNHRIRVCVGLVMPKKLCGEVEVDETFVGGKNRNRHANKKVRNSRGRSFKDKTPVLGMLQRGGMVVCQVVRNTSYKALTPPIIKTIKLRTTLYSDEWSGYNVISKFYRHYIVDHGRGQYVDGNAYTNTIEGFWGILKRGLIAIYNGVSRKHLQRYVNEFCFRYNTRNDTPQTRFELLLCNIGCRITYKELTR